MKDVPEKELLSAYLDGELTAAEQAQAERLLATDPSARRLLDDLRALSSTLQGLPQMDLKEDLSQRVLRAAEQRMLTAPDDRPIPASLERPFWREISWRGMLSARSLAWTSLILVVALLLSLQEQPGNVPADKEQIARAEQEEPGQDVAAKTKSIPAMIDPASDAKKVPATPSSPADEGLAKAENAPAVEQDSAGKTADDASSTPGAADLAIRDAKPGDATPPGAAPPAVMRAKVAERPEHRQLAKSDALRGAMAPASPAPANKSDDSSPKKEAMVAGPRATADQRKLDSAKSAGKPDSSMLAENGARLDAAPAAPAAEPPPPAATPPALASEQPSPPAEAVAQAAPRAAPAPAAAKPVDAKGVPAQKALSMGDRKEKADEDTLVVHCDLSAEAVRRGAFEEILAQNGVAVLESTKGSLTEQPPNIEAGKHDRADGSSRAVFVHATSEQIDKVLTQLKQRSKEFPALEVKSAGDAVQRESLGRMRRNAGEKQSLSVGTAKDLAAPDSMRAMKKGQGNVASGANTLNRAPETLAEPFRGAEASADKTGSPEAMEFRAQGEAASGGMGGGRGSGAGAALGAGSRIEPPADMPQGASSPMARSLAGRRNLESGAEPEVKTRKSGPPQRAHAELKEEKAFHAIPAADEAAAATARRVLFVLHIRDGEGANAASVPHAAKAEAAEPANPAQAAPAQAAPAGK